MAKAFQLYTTAVKKLLKKYDAEAITLRPEGRSILLAQPKRATDVIILFHGFTNSPKQFEALGKKLFNAGYTVYIPRAPHHGLKNRLTRDLQSLRLKELLEYATQSVDEVKPLGKRVSVMGISMGGALACYLGQTRDDLHLVMPIAPMLGLSFAPPKLTRSFELLLSVLPNYYMWWDPRARDKSVYSVEHAYPGYPSRALAEIIKLALVVRHKLHRLPLQSKKAIIVMNEKEPGVSNPAILQLYSAWKEQRGKDVSLVSLPAAWSLPHDCITPGTPGLNHKPVYARLQLELQKALRHV